MEVKEKHIYFGAQSALTALGDLDASLKALSDGVSGIGYDPGYRMLTAAIPQKDILQIMRPGYTRFESLVISRIEEVIASSGVSLSDSQVQLVLSTTKGNVDLLEGCGDRLPREVYIDCAADRIAACFKAANPPVIISNACISGVSAFVVAERMIVSGRCRHVIVAGCDVLCEFITSGFASFKSISGKPCRPYDRDRDGLTLGEAAAAVLLTDDRRLALEPVICLTGGAVSNDANHISGPSRTGDGLFYAIRNALEEAGFSASDIGMVNAHGTATAYNDEMESKAIAWADLSETPLNSLKGYIGHTLGASGVVETIFCLEELRRGEIFGTIGFKEPGTPCPLNVSSGSRQIDRRTCVKTASGFGGCNAAIVLAEEKSACALSFPGRTESEVLAEYELPASDREFSVYIREMYHGLNAPNMKFFKMSDLCKALYIAVEHLLSGNERFRQVPQDRRAILLSNRDSSLEADIRHQQILDEHHEEGASPAVFVYTLPNVAAGEMCIRHRIQGDNTFFIEGRQTSLSEDYARFLIETGKVDIAICGYCDKLGENWRVSLKLISKKM